MRHIEIGPIYDASKDISFYDISKLLKTQEFSCLDDNLKVARAASAIGMSATNAIAQAGTGGECTADLAGIVSAAVMAATTR
ncbi:hypothetical protein [Pseudolabrys taiwanensis]|uniref:hypothetical protein n=1 Tax=Pseudolabrys taiwanensis TaxID=331696 RepID=UPI001FE1F4DE|nr:hypothetical protein [Pseudolabrys taiwanensis]